MPLYQYELESGPGCPACRRGFELNRPLSRPPLTTCPLCKSKVRRIISRFQTPTVTKPFSTLDAKNAGFQVFKRRDHGVYERE